MMDFQRAKKDLNTFFQRFRRIDSEPYYIPNKNPNGRKKFLKRWRQKGEFKYFWKMEPQKRGAIHFHLMLFAPDSLFPDGWSSSKALRLQYIQVRVSSMWNEISAQSENFRAIRSKNGKIFGNMALYSGTQVQDVKNWKMATGYLASYMKKEFTGCDPETGEVSKWYGMKTGRYWGFSNNFDFSVMYQERKDISEIQKVQQDLKIIQSASFHQYLEHERENVRRIKASRKDKQHKQRLIDKILKRVKKQRRRNLINLKKIEMGAMVQIELNHLDSKKLLG
ncbi:MAG: hypothetical protein LC658_12895 [Bacteroidales bacterium]|nr:hypothetical protein [Bacteroidales bacterium]